MNKSSKMLLKMYYNGVDLFYLECAFHDWLRWFYEEKNISFQWLDDLMIPAVNKEIITMSLFNGRALGTEAATIVDYDYGHSLHMKSPQVLSLWRGLPLTYCPACQTTLVATRFRVAVIRPIIQVPRCIRVFFYFVWFVFINHIFQFYYELCTYCNILDIYLS